MAKTVIIRAYLILILSLTCYHLQAQNSQKPNILLIVADDLGYADLGCFGSEISTPNIDNLALEGTLFTNYYSMPSCAPTRASLLTGVDNHVAGMGCQFYMRENRWGYEGHLSDRVLTIPQILKTAGYKTYMTGKWHLGKRPEDNPSNKGFDESFVLLQGAASHYSNHPFEPDDTESLYTSNGQGVDWPEGAYSTKIYTDSLIKFMGNGLKNDQPFFAFAAFTSPHWPLQVESKYWKKYQGKYKEGYEKLRAKNLENLKKAGIISPKNTLPPLHPNITPWDSIPPIEQLREARKMELYAGMVDNLDFHIGRIIEFLKENNLYDNTLIVFASDNGAAAEDFYNRPPFKDIIRKNFNNAYDNMGSPTSWVAYDKQWAEASSAPFRNHKQYSHEGGIRVPMMMKLPKENNSIQRSTQFVKLTDLAPTFYDYAGAKYPSVSDEQKIAPLSGTSMMPYLTGKSTIIHSNDESWFIEHGLRSMVKQGDWKLVNSLRKSDNTEFQLFNLKEDPMESTDVSKTYPNIKTRLFDIWKQNMKQLQILNNYDE